MTPEGVLLCPPDHFDVIDVKNPFMAGQTGRVDRARARAQWEALRATLASIGLEVHTLAPAPGLEDMVFTANPSFAGPGVCLLSRMRHPSRQREVEHHAAWFRARGCRTAASPHPCEGGGDLVWHPGGGVIWAAAGPRTAREAHAFVAELFGVEVIPLALRTEEFYHLDTCFCPLDAETVMLYPPALADDRPVRERFPRVIEVSAEDARARFACNALAHDGHVVLERGCGGLERLLEDLGYAVHPVDTGEFLKSGGSVYCLKQWVW